MSSHFKTRFATTFTIVWVISILMSLFAGGAGASNAGTIKIDDWPFDASPANDPGTATCPFQIDLFNYEANAVGTYEVTLQNPSLVSPAASPLNTLQTGGPATLDADGADGSLDHEFSVDLTAPLLAAYAAGARPAPQGWHVKVVVNVSDPGAPGGTDSKFKTFFVDGTCGVPPAATGTVKVKKVVTGANADQDLDFTFSDTIPNGDVTAKSHNDGFETINNVPTGNWNVSETNVPANWTLTNVSCTGDADSSGAVATGASIDVDANDVIECTFTNDYTAPVPPRPGTGTVTIKKLVTGAGADQDLDFTFNDTIPTGNVASQSHNDAVQTFTSVPIGNWSVTETNLPPNWALTGVTCLGDADSGGSAAAGASIDVDAGDTINCTFTNTYTAPAPPCCVPPAPSADVSLTKTDLVDPVVAGQNITYTVSVTNNGPNTAVGVTVSDTLPAGTGFVSATPSVGTCSSSSPISCSLGDLVSGQNVTITVVASTSAATPASVTNTASASSPT